METPILSVTEVNNRIKSVIENEPFTQFICISGELSNYKIYGSGHHYFTLKDKDSSLHCVMFRGEAQKLRFRPENGLAVLAFGRISVYGRDGVYQLYCSAMRPSGTGDLQLAFEQLKKKLESEGLFDRSHKKPLPRFPHKIALVTSPSGAAVHDMIRILGTRWPQTSVLVVPARVQGVEAPGEIAAAIDLVNALNAADLIITGRGGGSIEDLWAFNEEVVARAIYRSEIPIISAVGHEPDVTISDYVADCRASTPSNAAEIAVPDIREWYQTLSVLQEQARKTACARIEDNAIRLIAYKARLCVCDPESMLRSAQNTLNLSRERLFRLMETIIADKRLQLASVSASLDASSPLKKISNGYAAVTELESGRSVCSVTELRNDDRLRLYFSDGFADAVIKNIVLNGEQHVTGNVV